MKKTNLYLVEYCLEQVGNPYWSGGFGQIATKDFYNQNKNRLNYGAWEGDYALDVGMKVHDCNGMVKGAMWCDGPNVGWKQGQYQINGLGDWGVDEMYKQCSEKGTIKTLPELPGVLLFNKSFSHMGIYIGDGKVVEARDHNRGVQLNALKDRQSFELWGKLTSCFDYIKPVQTEPKRAFEDEIKAFQKWLNKTYGENLAVDGGCGPATKKAAIKAMQIELNKEGEKLVVDGGCGPLTKAALSRHMIKKVTRNNMAYIVQGLLYGAGYNPNGFDGSYNNGAEKATKLYQEKKGLEVDGKIGGETFYSLTR